MEEPGSRDARVRGVVWGNEEFWIGGESRVEQRAAVRLGGGVEGWGHGVRWDGGEWGAKSTVGREVSRRGTGGGWVGAGGGGVTSGAGRGEVRRARGLGGTLGEGGVTQGFGMGGGFSSLSLYRAFSPSPSLSPLLSHTHTYVSGQSLF